VDSGATDDHYRWSSRSGFVALLQAEDRLRVARRAMVGVTDLIGSIQHETASEASEELDRVRKDPDAAGYLFEAEVEWEDQVLAVRGELPLMLYGTLIVYLFSLLESSLADCLEAVIAIRKESTPSNVPSPKLEGYVEALADRDVTVEWSQETWNGIREWRTKRNSIVHRLEAPTDAFGPSEGPGSNDRQLGSLAELAELIEQAVADVDSAMARIEKEPSAPPPSEP
jgi:hypothetical protein